MSTFGQKAIAVVMSFILSFTMAGVTAMSALASQLESSALLPQASSSLVYDDVYGVFGGEYALMYKDVIFEGEYMGLEDQQVAEHVVDVVRSDGTVTLHTSYSMSMTTPDAASYPGVWSDYRKVALKGEGQDLIEGFVAVQSKSTGKTGVKKLDGSDLVPCVYDAIWPKPNGGFITITYEAERVVVAFFGLDGSALGDMSVPVEGDPQQYQYNNVVSAGNYLHISGYTYAGAFDIMAHEDGAVYSVLEGYVSMLFSAHNKGFLFEKTDGNVYYYDAASDSVTRIVSSDGVSWGNVEGNTIHLTIDAIDAGTRSSYFSTSGSEISAWGGSYANCSAGDTAVFEISDNYDEYGNREYAVCGTDGALISSFKSVGVSSFGDSYYQAVTRVGESYYLKVLDANGALKKEVGEVSESWARIYPRSTWNDLNELMPCGYVLYSSWSVNGEDVYYDSDLNEVSEYATDLSLGDGTRLSFSSADGGVAAFDSNGVPVMRNGYSIAVDRSGNHASWNSVKRGAFDVWWAKDGTGKWGAIDTNGNVRIPFLYDAYFDYGRSDTNYALAKQEDSWQFLDAMESAGTAEKPGTAEGSGASGGGSSTAGGQSSIEGSQVQKDISSAVFAPISGLVYTGLAITPSVNLTLNGVVLAQDVDFTVAYGNNVNAGTASIVAVGIGRYAGQVSTTFAIGKAANPMKAKASSKLSVKRKVLKKKARALKAIVFAHEPAGKVTYENMSGKGIQKKFKLNKRSGKITVAKGTKRGTYKVKVKVKAAGDSNYRSASKNVVVKVKVV